MTIKQLGGVFGRNPTFNDVTIEGQLTFNGDIDIDSDLKVDGDLDVTGTSNLAAIAGTGNVVLGNTVTNPASNFANQRGFGWNDSTKVLEISSSVAPLELGRTSGGGDGQLLVFRQATNVAAEIRVEGNAGYFKPYNGGGIDFSATSDAPGATSELLDDYEEGTFTPSLEDDAGNDYSGTYGYQEGSYTKIGNSVRFTLRIYANQSLTSNGLTGSEVLRIKSLPFLHADDNIGTGISINNGGNFNYDAGYTQALGLVAPNKSYIIFRQLGDSVTANNLTVTKCDSIGGVTGFYAFVSGVYVV